MPRFSLRPASNAIDPRPPVIFVVDDDAAVLASLKFALELDGLEIQTVDNGLKLLKHPSLANASCIVLDYKMPGMDGFEVLTELERRNIKVPVILITSPITERTRARARRAGNVVFVLEKPLLDNLLLDHIRKLIGPG